jgi:aldehyde dehydrogenase (NAD+)
MATPPPHIEDRLFINGEFVPSIAGKKFDVFNPTTEKVTASIYEALAEDVDVAVDAASAAFPAWSGLPASERGNYLNKLADEIIKAKDEIGYLDAVTMGKPILIDGIAIKMVAEFLRYCAGKAYDITGESSLSQPDYVNMTFRQPYGVCGAIVSPKT